MDLYEDSIELTEVDAHHNYSTPSQAYYNFLKSLLGLGIITLPYVGQQVGWLWAFILMLPIVFCVLRSSLFLIEIADDLNNNFILYNDIARVTISGFWPEFIDFLIVFQQIGCCCAYLIFLTSFLQYQFTSYGVELPSFFYYFLTTFVIVPLSFVRNLHFFHSVSQFGFGLAMMALFLVAGNCLWLFLAGNALAFEDPIKPLKSFSFIGVAIFTFEGILTILPVRDSMNDKNLFKSVFISATFAAAGLSALVLEITVLTFGESSTEIIFFNISQREIQLLASLLYAFSLLFTYSLQLFPAIQIISQFISMKPYSQINQSEISRLTTKTKSDEVFVSDWLDIIQRVLITTLIYVVSYFIPNLSSFVGLLGSILGTLLQYVFPVLFHWIHFRQRSQQAKLTYFMILSFSAFALILGTFSSAHDMSKHQSKPPQI